MPRPRTLIPPLTTLSVRIGEEEREALEILSEAYEQSASEIVRDLILRDLERIENLL